MISTKGFFFPKHLFTEAIPWARRTISHTLTLPNSFYLHLEAPCGGAGKDFNTSRFYGIIRWIEVYKWSATVCSASKYVCDHVLVTWIIYIYILSLNCETSVSTEYKTILKKTMLFTISYTGIIYANISRFILHSVTSWSCFATNRATFTIFQCVHALCFILPHDFTHVLNINYGNNISEK